MYSGKPLAYSFSLQEVSKLKLLYGIHLAENPVVGSDCPVHDYSVQGSANHSAVALLLHSGKVFIVISVCCP